MASRKDVIIEWLISNVESLVEVHITSRLEDLKKTELIELVNFLNP